MDELIFDSPVGVLRLCAENGVITGLYFGGVPSGNSSDPALLEGKRQLEQYFSGERREFNIELNMEGTEFQKSVWEELRKIPYGETRTYGEIAKGIGAPKAARAVGMANNRNPVAIIVPCHRVIGANGKMVGYGGGLPIKEYLLKLERDAG